MNIRDNEKTKLLSNAIAHLNLNMPEETMQAAAEILENFHLALEQLNLNKVKEALEAADKTGIAKKFFVNVLYYSVHKRSPLYRLTRILPLKTDPELKNKINEVIEIAKYLINECKADLTSRTPDGLNNTPLLAAIVYAGTHGFSDKAPCPELIDLYMHDKVINTKDTNLDCLNSPLMMAIKTDQEDAASRLLEVGARIFNNDSSTVLDHDAYGMNILEYACILKSNKPIVKILEKLDPDLAKKFLTTQNKWGCTPI